MTNERKMRKKKGKRREERLTLFPFYYSFLSACLLPAGGLFFSSPI
jgi:hypothetical protein